MRHRRSRNADGNAFEYLASVSAFPCRRACLVRTALRCSTFLQTATSVEDAQYVELLRFFLLSSLSLSLTPPPRPSMCKVTLHHFSVLNGLPTLMLFSADMRRAIWANVSAWFASPRRSGTARLEPRSR